MCACVWMDGLKVYCMFGLETLAARNISWIIFQTILVLCAEISKRIISPIDRHTDSHTNTGYQLFLYIWYHKKKTMNGSLILIIQRHWGENNEVHTKKHAHHHMSVQQQQQHEKKHNVNNLTVEKKNAFFYFLFIYGERDAQRAVSMWDESEIRLV